MPVLVLIREREEQPAVFHPLPKVALGPSLGELASRGVHGIGDADLERATGIRRGRGAPHAVPRSRRHLPRGWTLRGTSGRRPHVLATPCAAALSRAAWHTQAAGIRAP